jgi:uncharacterized membrane protein YraQ (UPF0718 family)
VTTDVDLAPDRVPGAAPLLPRSNVVGLGIFLGLLVAFLASTRLPATLQKFDVVGEGQSGRGQSTFGRVLDPGAYDEPVRWLAYGANLWDANAIGMFFAMLLGGAAVASLAPGARLQSVLRRRGVLGAGTGGLLGMPLFLCSACSSPVSLGFYRNGAAVETSLGMILGSALFNPVGIVAVVLLFPPPLALARIGFGIAAILLLVPLAARWAAPRCAPLGELPLGLPPEDPDDSWGGALWDGVGRWLANSADVAVRLGPPMLLATLAVGVVLTLVPPQELSERVGTGVAAIVVTAALGTLIQLPTLFEIPLVIGVLALGVGVGPAAALLVTAPSAGLVTLAVTRADLGWRPVAVLLAGTFAGGVAAGVLVSLL